ncbi:MAG TPA: hypothetical protein VF223_19115 [Trebonia sp.]
MGAEAPDAVTVAYVHSNEVAYSWHHSLVEMVGYDMAREGRILRGGYIAMRCGTGGLVDARNKTVSEFLASKDAEWLLWTDTDMGFPADACERLIEAADPAERPVVGALCFTQRETEPDGMGGWRCRAVPTVFDWAQLPSGKEGFLVRWDYPHNTLVQCAGTGSAVILIHRSVFSRIAARYGPVWYDQAPNPTTGQLIGEDLSFCARAGAVGIPVFVHTGIPTTHMKRLWLTEDDYFGERLADPPSLLRGRSESVLFGKRVELAASWPDGPPEDFSPEQLARLADMMDAERGRLAVDGEPDAEPEPEPAASPA